MPCIPKAQGRYFDLDDLEERNRQDAPVKEKRLWAHSWGWPGADDGKAHIVCLVQLGISSDPALGKCVDFKVLPNLLLFNGADAWWPSSLEHMTLRCLWSDFIKIKRHLKKCYARGDKRGSHLARINWAEGFIFFPESMER